MWGLPHQPCSPWRVGSTIIPSSSTSRFQLSSFRSESQHQSVAAAAVAAAAGAAAAAAQDNSTCCLITAAVAATYDALV